ncbi:MAG: hypothetical protein ACI87J_000612 [Colwellia sp.]
MTTINQTKTFFLLDFLEFSIKVCIKDVTMNSVKLNFSILILLFSSFFTYGDTYTVGPNQTYENLNKIPWLELIAGDTVLIHHRDEPYRTKIGLHSIGTKDKPVTISGVANYEGKLPIISGENATTPDSLIDFFSEKWDEANALILIKRDRSIRWGLKPSHIIIENLILTGASTTNQFTDQFGKKRNYAQSSAAIWASLVDTLSVKNCQIIDNGNGIFVLSKNSEEEISRNILIEGNTFSNNGVENSFRQHNIYTQAAGIIIQHNKINSLRPLSKGAAIKDRSSGTVIRYNKIFAGAYAIDLVDPEDSYKILTQEPNFHDTWVYGNTIISAANNENRVYASRLIHYGGDTGVTEIYRKGTLHFFHNTVFLDIYSTHNSLPLSWRTRLFIMDTNDESVEASNNIFYSHGDTNVSWLSGFGHLTLSGTNWVSTNTAVNADNIEFSGSYTNNSKMILGKTIGFTDIESYNFKLRNGSSALDSASLSDKNSSELHPLTSQYNEDTMTSPRRIEGTYSDLGAFEGKAIGDGPFDSKDNIIIDPEALDSWPLASAGPFTENVTGIKSVYPAPLTKVSLLDKLEIQFASDTIYEWTSGRKLKLYDNNANLLADIDLEPGSPNEGEHSISFLLSDLGIKNVGIYYITIDSGFVKFPSTPWKTAKVSNSQWIFAAVDDINNTTPIDPNNSATWPITYTGPLADPVSGITELYPAPITKVLKTDNVEISFSSVATFEWTSGRKLSVYDEHSTLISTLDLQEGDINEGTSKLSYSLNELGILNIGIYNLVLDYGFVKLAQSPWRNSLLDYGQWKFVVVESY